MKYNDNLCNTYYSFVTTVLVFVLRIVQRVPRPHGPGLFCLFFGGGHGGAGFELFGEPVFQALGVGTKGGVGQAAGEDAAEDRDGSHDAFGEGELAHLGTDVLLGFRGVEHDADEAGEFIRGLFADQFAVLDGEVESLAAVEVSELLDDAQDEAEVLDHVCREGRPGGTGRDGDAGGLIDFGADDLARDGVHELAADAGCLRVLFDGDARHVLRNIVSDGFFQELVPVDDVALDRQDLRDGRGDVEVKVVRVEVLHLLDGGLAGVLDVLEGDVLRLVRQFSGLDDDVIEELVRVLDELVRIEVLDRLDCLLRRLLEEFGQLFLIIIHCI